MNTSENFKQLKLALVQTPLVWENPAANLKILDAKLATISTDVNVVVLPEMFTTGFTMTPEHIDSNESATVLNWMKEKAMEYDFAIVGSVVFEESAIFYNRLFFVKPNGEYSFYDKRHTFTLAGESNTYQSGKELLIVEYLGFKFCPLICYDLRFPVWSRNTSNYDVLIYVANWPAPRITAWDTLLKARAIENMSYCVGVNRIGTDHDNHEYPGHSAIYDPLGHQLSFTKEEEIVEVLIIKEEITKVRSKLRFLEDRDHFTLLD